jgi:hypothetical protein
MKIITYILSVFLVTLWCSCTSQKMISSNTIESGGFKLYRSLGGEPETVRNTFKADGLNRVVLINQRNIDNLIPWTLDNEVLKNFVNTRIKNPKDNALIVLDWEGEVMDAVIGGRTKNPVLYDRVAKLMIAAYQTVKTMRPRATIGYYGYPIRNYHSRNEKWRAKNEGLDELFSNFDALFPSLYDFYHDDESATRKARDIGYVNDNTTEAIRMGDCINKPVYPFIWHRYHPSNKKRGWQPIPVDEFREHLKSMLSATVNDHRVDGLVWWGSDWSQFAARNKRKIARKELRGKWEGEAMIIFPLYYNVIKEVSEDVGRR